ncbi:MAG: N-formylglutamate amidohydrolase [Caulobacterales bacterium]
MTKSWADSEPPSNLLLANEDPPPFAVTNRGGASPFLLIGDHAGRAIPGRLESLGLKAEELETHIAWDIGVTGLGERLAWALDACFIRQTYSRLVIDCNRRPADPTAIPEISDGASIPGNVELDAVSIAARRREIYQPYQDAIAAELDRRSRFGRDTLLVSLHSFTPSLGGRERPWRMGVLHRNDSPFSARFLTLLKRALGGAAGDNQPYRMDETDNTIPLHVDPRGLDYLELEVRQDLIADELGCVREAELIAGSLQSAFGAD